MKRDRDTDRERKRDRGRETEIEMEPLRSHEVALVEMNFMKTLTSSFRSSFLVAVK